MGAGRGSRSLLAAIGDVAHPSWRASAVGGIVVAQRMYETHATTAG